ncbi:hypothetical protein ACFE04_012706 [Oxalis oulophora]
MSTTTTTFNSYFFSINTNDEYDHLASDDDPLEFEESDLYNNNNYSVSTTRSNSAEFRSKSKSCCTSRLGNYRMKGSVLNASLPVNVPKWSKTLGDELLIDGRGDREVMIPPHELLARTRMASFSVHEGVGRTLKGRDLSKVRNAIWEKTGFQC